MRRLRPHICQLYHREVRRVEDGRVGNECAVKDDRKYNSEAEAQFPGEESVSFGFKASDEEEEKSAVGL